MKPCIQLQVPSCESNAVFFLTSPPELLGQQTLHKHTISPMCSNWCLALHIFCMICCYLSHCSRRNRLLLVVLVKHTAVRSLEKCGDSGKKSTVLNPILVTGCLTLYFFYAFLNPVSQRSTVSRTFFPLLLLLNVLAYELNYPTVFMLNTEGWW